MAMTMTDGHTFIFRYEHNEAVLYQNMYFDFRWQPETPYGAESMNMVCHIGVSALMNQLKGTWIDSAAILYVIIVLYFLSHNHIYK